MIKTAFTGPRAARYEATRFQDPVGAIYDERERDHLLRALDVLPPGAPVLEVGCGTGRFLTHVLARGHAACGVEPSPDMVRLARERCGSDGWLCRGEGARLPIGSGRVALTYAIRVLHQTGSAAYSLSLLDEMIRATRRGGLLLVEFPNRLRPRRVPRRDAYFSIEDVVGRLRASGCRVERIDGVWFLPEGLFRLAPAAVRGALLGLDRLLSRRFPQGCDHPFVLARKIGPGPSGRVVPPPGCRLHVVAGPHGAGKTMFVLRRLRRVLRGREPIPFEWISAGLGHAVGSGRQEGEGLRSLLRAARTALAASIEWPLAFQALRWLARRSASGPGSDLVAHTTFANPALLKRLDRVEEAGVRVHVHFLWLPSSALSHERVAHRVEEGGHAVEDSPLERAYDLGLADLRTAAASSAYDLSVYDASGPRVRLVARRSRGRGWCVIERDLWGAILGRCRPVEPGVVPGPPVA